jgi:hypothetical protein
MAETAYEEDSGFTHILETVARSLEDYRRRLDEITFDGALFPDFRLAGAGRRGKTEDTQDGEEGDEKMLHEKTPFSTVNRTTP